MINISTTSPVSWPTPPSAAVAPVSATSAIKPVQSDGREAKNELESRRDARRTRARADEEARPATPQRASDAEPKASAQARQEAAAQRAEQAVKKAEADKASHRKAMDRLQEVLTNMWAASAAVVDHALGLEPKAEALPGNQSDTAPDLSAVAASTMPRRLLPGAKTADAPAQTAPENMPWPVMPQSTDEAAAELAPEVPGGEVIAYDENGQSSLAPLEVGTLLSEKV
ncbi:hypothetical protein [Hydrogenophaga sp.]|jgi:hypothetical protein|uniref:hypothetical protein n=1 Tax=Hydrogenophaga sp. TaxID=1904254 RepID=UPI0025BC0F91|nr:hypothetical protein [Hydrogenophaga sp.]MDO9135681.1 hypothetical protein [Hydrogenophaga sp.]MDO9506539.1 hypothetical protein [Hydrogenophaga sp.]MDP3626659.1 hypothetical protein [Hydrogenophaga sp.]